MRLRGREAPSALLLGLAFLAACSVKAPVYGLRPSYPEVLRRSGGGSEAVFTLVDSTRPQLRWEDFPPRDEAGLPIAEPALAKVKWVVYDVKVYREENGSPGALVEEKSGIAEPRHQFQKELAPCARYFWSVRARFLLEGREEATEWGVVASPGRDRWVPVTPDPGYFRFQTPCGKPRS
ncbi:MAG: hypothetical protein HY077_13845 [Elusimicrobia bacterium]|nr:hypothetical protein [Elusimicrobiota bacterium]